MTRTVETAKMLMSFYNMQAGTSFRLGENERKINIVLDALERANGDVATLKQHIRKWLADTPADERRPMVCFESFVGVQPTTVEVTAPSVAPSEDQVSNSMTILEQALVKVVAETSSKKIEDEIMGSVKQTIADFIKSEYGTIERKVITVVDGERKDLEGVVHEKFDTILKFVKNNEPVYLSGPAGSGKNYICKQIADTLGLKFYFTNAVTQEYKLTGFTDAMGNYQPTQFYKAFTEGGLFMLDELDASIPEVLIILNAAIANRYFDFPAPIGYKEAHPDFRIIAAGNTLGHGADYEYVGRSQLDGASLDRFATVPVDYSVDIENGIANDIELADFCRDFRRASKKVGVQIIVSYRSISRLSKMVQIMELTEALSTCLIKGLGNDDLRMIYNELQESKYKRAIGTLIAQAS